MEPSTRPRVLTVDPHHPDPAAIAEAAEVLLRGGLVAFPTETVYGLGALARDERAVGRIYAAKGRPSHNPLIAHVESARAARALARHWPGAAEALASAFWPGPLTLVVERAEGAPGCLSAGLATLAVRVPAHPVALALLRAVGAPLAAPSANPSGRLSPTRAEHVLRSLGARVDRILDGGPCRVGIESAVVDVRGERPRLLRPGTLTQAELEAIAGPFEDPRSGPPSAVEQVSPGLERSHYAPRAPLVLAEAPEIRAGAGPRDGWLVRRTLGLDHGAEVVLGETPEVWANRLYEELHRLDESVRERIWVEAPPKAATWDGVRDRLERASAPRP